MPALDNPLYEPYSTYENPMHNCYDCLLAQVTKGATWKRIADGGSGAVSYMCDEHKTIEQLE